MSDLVAGRIWESLILLLLLLSPNPETHIYVVVNVWNLYIKHLLKNEWNSAIEWNIILLVCLQFAATFLHQLIKNANKIAERGEIMHYTFQLPTEEDKEIL